MPCSRDTVNPPAPTTTSTTSGIHSRLRTLKIETPPASFPAWAPARTCNYTPSATRHTAPYLMMWVSEAGPATVTSNVRRLAERGEAVTSKPGRLPPDRRVVNTYGIVMQTACVKARYGILRTHSQIRSCTLSPRWRSLSSSASARKKEAPTCGSDRGSRALASLGHRCRVSGVGWGRRPRRGPLFRRAPLFQLPQRAAPVSRSRRLDAVVEHSVRGVARARPDVAIAGRRDVSRWSGRRPSLL